MSCRRCCVVWLRLRDGQVQRGCPHCWRVIGKHDETDEDLARGQVERSRQAHAGACPLPVRWGSDAPTPVVSAQQSAEAARAQRLRYSRR